MSTKNKEPFKIKESFIELADCNTSLVHLGPTPPGGPLRFATDNEYHALYQGIASGPSEFATIAGQPGAVLRRLKPAYRGNRYWHRYYNSPNLETYVDSVWDRLVPIEARLNFLLTASPGNVAKIKVSPVPRVLLYPFGWSTWISLRVTGEHTLPTLATLLQQFVREPAYTLSPGPISAQTCAKVFGYIGKGVWADAFGGGKNTAASPPDILSVTTVLDKYNGAPAIGALETDEESALATLISPNQPLTDGIPQGIIRGLPLGGKDAGNLDYVLQNGFATFIWAEHKLKSINRNRQQLHCYHHNTFLSLLHARQLTAFLSLASNSKEKTPALSGLVQAAIAQIDEQLNEGDAGYRSVSLVSYLERENVQKTLAKARKVFKPSEKESTAP
jgi:hypothetical protein